ncbi:hypothetical protein ONZ43_g5464 [Nemania bipapillata]|uniref:Uncharacterized protein n=1 Tax=Nemania bipapillata TaxID=110536 RepID=A0ACC2IAE6_9PEZI|nr:hypothetical protein ONZ43_g5464 [Nemania bipapillata]
MAVLKFTLSEDGVNVLRDALACLGKFSDEVSLEAKKDRLVLTALNTSKSAYASIAFATNRFFSKYQYAGVAQNRDKFFCKLYNRALLSLFRSRGGDPQHEREKDTTIDRCDVVITDEPGMKSRFVAKIVFRNGITTKYRLPFEVSPPVHAKFDKVEATNNWAITPRTLRQLMDHFGPGIDYLDIHADDEVVNFTCFTEAAANGDARPMQLRYDGDGIKCEYLLMTVGERGAPMQKTKKARVNAKGATAPQLEETSTRANSHVPTPAGSKAPMISQSRLNPMPSLRPPIERPSQRPPPATLESESLFVPQDNDEQWEPVNVDENDEEDDGRLGWDTSRDMAPPAMNMRALMANQQSAPLPSVDRESSPEFSQLEPTQRLSQVRKFGLFGD